MNYELKLLKSFCNKDIYSQYREYLSEFKEPELQILVSCIDQLHKSHETFSLDDLQAYVEVKHKNFKNILGLVKTIRELKDLDLSDLVVKELLDVIKERSIFSLLYEEAFRLSQGEGDKGKLEELYSRYSQLSESPEEKEEFVTQDLEDLSSIFSAESGISWRLECLNRSLGPLRTGDFGFVFARVEAGKTTFLASEASYMVEQVESPILWLNNEEQGKKVMLRIYQAVLGATLLDVLKDKKGSQHEFNSRTKGLIRIYDSSQITKREVLRLCGKIKPSLVIIDQLDKLKGFAADREDLRLGDIYQWTRELAKSYCPVIGVCQADGSGEGKKFLTMDNVTSAKTAKQAEADFIIGIGDTRLEEDKYTRWLNISKNKLLGSEKTNEEYRHGQFIVRINPTIARYSDIGKFK